MEIEQLIASKDKWTYSDWHLLPTELRCELIENNICLEPTPTFYHQNLSGKLEKLLTAFVDSNSLGYIIHAPLDVVFSEDTVLQPEIMFISNAQFGQIKTHFHGAPELVIEILSPSTAKYDRTKKKDIYEKFGVKEYWIVDQENRLIEVFELKDGKFQLHCAGQLKDQITSKVLQGFEFVTESIF